MEQAEGDLVAVVLIGDEKVERALGRSFGFVSSDLRRARLAFDPKDFERYQQEIKRRKWV